MAEKIIVVGCGGTGSHYIKELGRLLYGMGEKKKKYDLILVDGDLVEEKNLVRQAFLPQDIGCSKAQVMAEILSQAYGIDAEFYDRYIDTPSDLDYLVERDDMVLLVGCVDNHQCRQSMHDFYRSRQHCIYMDSANEYSVGEVVIGSRIGGVEMYADRSEYFPEVLEAKEARRSEESCEVLNASSPQHIPTNQLAAWILLVNTVRYFQGEWVGGMFMFDAFKCYSMDRTSKEEAHGFGGNTAA